MSSQAERIKAFKLAQHSRIQKQDEEEWISSEELFTEGSSDEDTQVCISTSKRKPKKGVRTEKRGISPLAQSPKPISEPCFSCLTDTKYLLPDLNVSNKVTDNLKNALLPENSASTQQEASTSKQESFDEEELEKMVQWRPKRGSIKLPEFSEGRFPSINHIIFETNIFFDEMKLNISSWKQRPLSKQKNTVIDTFSKELRESCFQSLITKQVKPRVANIIQDISELDVEIMEKSNMLEIAKQERLMVQDELCSNPSSIEVTSIHGSFQNFLQLCVLETGESIFEKEVTTTESNINNEKKPQIRIDNNNKFITKNIELAKRGSMVQVFLTNEEKCRLQSLLADIDSEEYNINSHEQLNYNDENLKECGTNYFKVEINDSQELEELDSKINALSYDEGVKREASLGNGEEEDLLENADKQGKFWRHYQLEKRLETIEKNLHEISVKELEARQKWEREKKLNEVKQEEKSQAVEEICQ